MFLSTKKNFFKKASVLLGIEIKTAMEKNVTNLHMGSFQLRGVCHSSKSNAFFKVSGSHVKPSSCDHSVRAR